VPPPAAAAGGAPLPAAATLSPSASFIRPRTDGGGALGMAPRASDGVGTTARAARPFGSHLPGSPHVPGVTLPTLERPFHAGAYTDPPPPGEAADAGTRALQAIAKTLLAKEDPSLQD
jgi:hypothetical protein